MANAVELGFHEARLGRGGALRLSAPVADVIPEFAKLGKERVTLFPLLTHTSGVQSSIPTLPPDVLANVPASGFLTTARDIHLLAPATIVRGEKPIPGPFGALNSPRTSTAFSIDPARDLTFEGSFHVERLARLSDQVVSAIVR